MTNQDFREEVLQRLTRIESLGEQKCNTVDDHESRIRVLEKFQWKRDGIRWALVFVIPMAVSACIKIWG